MGKFTLKKSLKRYTANVLNFLLLFSLIVPNVLSPAIVIAQDLDIEQEESITEIPTIPIDESEDILEEGISTSTFEEGIYTVSLVEEKEYVYPEDDRVRIRFTSITEEGDLTIKKVILTEEEKLSLNTTDEYAWDFTSTMSNGSFTYDLVLPNNQGEEIEVKYSEDGSTYSPIEEILVNEGIVKISGLDHFTTFIVVPLGTIPGGVTKGSTEVDGTYRIHSSIYSQRTFPLNYLVGGQNHSETFIVDSTKPSTPELLSPIDNYFTNQTSVIQTWTSTDTDIAYYEYESCSNDPDSDGSCTRIYSTTTRNTSRTVNNNNITFWWRVRAIDIAGNMGNWSEARKITIDTTKPSTPEFFAPENNLYTNINFIKLEWTGGDDTDSGVKGYVLGYTFTPANGGTEKTWNTGLREVGNPHWHSGTYGHGEGTYVFWVKTVNNADNESETSELLTVTYDKTAPEAPSIVFPSEGQYFNSTPILNDWTHSTDPSGIKGYRIKYLTPNGEILRDTISSQRNHKPSISDQGEITIWVQAIDKVGNEGAWSDPVHYYYDKTGPEILFGGLRYINSTTTVDTSNIYTNDNTPIIFFTASDTLGTVVEASVNGYSATYDGTYWVAEITNPLPEGINSLSIKAKDNAGNESQITHDIFVDTKAPFAQYTYYKDGEKILSSTAYVQEVSQLSFLGQYMDDAPSSGILKDSYVIFDSNSLGTARTSKAYCGWRGTGNTVTIIPYTEKVLFTNCEPTLPDGQYFMYHQVYDNAVRKDIPTITQFRDVKGLHFVVDTIAPVVEITSPSENDSLSGEVIIQGNVKDQNLSHYNISIYDGDADVNDFSKRLLQNTEYTTEFDTKNLLTWDTTEFANGEYQIRLAARDLAGNRDDDTSIRVIKVIVDNTPPTTTGQPTQNEGEVQGVTTGSNTTTNSPTLAKKVTTFIADILGVGGEGDVLALEEDEETLEDDTEEVKGSQTCDNPSTISGYIYIDSNENGEKDEKERVFPEISIRIYTITEGMEETVKQIVSDENGYWETTLCSGDYYISVDDSKLPNNYVLEEDTLGVQVEEDKDSTLNFEVLDERNFLQKYWPWILLAVGILGSIGIVAVDTRRKKEYI